MDITIQNTYVNIKDVPDYSLCVTNNNALIMRLGGEGSSVPIVYIRNGAVDYMQPNQQVRLVKSITVTC